MKQIIAMLATFVLFVGSAVGQISPTTTLQAETSNNTSAANTFGGTPNGNIAATNISKVSIHTMFPGFEGPILAHTQMWFGTSSHVNVGYDNTSLQHSYDLLTDLASRGFDGMIHDYYGPASNSHVVAQTVLSQMLHFPNLVYVTSLDAGLLKSYNKPCSTCSDTQNVILALQKVKSDLWTSPNYWRINGRPVVLQFGFETYTTIDWNKVQTTFPEMLWVWRNSGGFTKAISAGSYAWGPSYDQTYIDNFFQVADKYPVQLAGANFSKGFNDTIAAWSKNRIVDQQCGQHYLTTIGWNTGHVDIIDFIQLSTWDDYEEGTELETGVSNCLTINASFSGSTLNWAISGQENTLDHYEVFGSLDGTNLSKLTDVPLSNRSFDIGSFSLNPATYQFFVKAVGRPSITNHMSNAVTITVSPVVLGPVNIIAPRNGITTCSPVQVVATVPNTDTIQTIKVYVDGVVVYTVNGNWVDTLLTMGAGTHRVTVSAWNISGNLYKSSYSITVR